MLFCLRPTCLDCLLLTLPFYGLLRSKIGALLALLLASLLTSPSLWS